MANVNASLCFLTLLLCLVSCSCTRVSWDAQSQKKQNVWCIARTVVPAQKLQEALDFACSKVNCAEIQQGGSCFFPDTLQNHASYALDLYFRSTGVCNFDVATPAVSDPSFGSCHYP